MFFFSCSIFMLPMSIFCHISLLSILFPFLHFCDFSHLGGNVLSVYLDYCFSMTTPSCVCFPEHGVILSFFADAFIHWIPSLTKYYFNLYYPATSELKHCSCIYSAELCLGPLPMKESIWIVFPVVVRLQLSISKARAFFASVTLGLVTGCSIRQAASFGPAVWFSLAARRGLKCICA